jgi:hypothetical protein
MIQTTIELTKATLVSPENMANTNTKLSKNAEKTTKQSE